MVKIKKFAVPFAVLLAVTTLAGCGNKGSSTSSSTSTTTSSSTSTSTSTSTTTSTSTSTSTTSTTSSSTSTSTSTPDPRVENSITMEAVYTSLCHSGLSDDEKDAIVALGGEITIKYFEDKSCETEITDLNLITGGNTYYVQASTEGNAQYLPATEVAELRVSHKEDDIVVPTGYIGYKEIYCSICEELVGAGDPMESSDINFKEALYSADCDAVYGKTPGEPSWAQFIGDGGMVWALNNTETPAQTRDIKLPLIDFTAFTNVVIKWKLNCDSTLFTSFGINSDEELVSFEDHGTYYEGIFEIKYDEGQSKATLNCLDFLGSLDKTIDITNSKILVGNEPIVLKTKADKYRNFGISKILLNHTHEYGQEICPTDHIGYKNRTCGECGYREFTSPMMKEDINIKANTEAYGAKAMGLTKNTTEGINEADYMMWGGGEEELTTFNLQLPRVNYKAYSYVDIFFKTSSATWSSRGAVGFELNNNDDLLPYGLHGTAATVNFNVCYDGTKLIIKSLSSDGVSGSAILESESVASGLSSLVLKFKGDLYRACFLYSITPTVVSAELVNELAEKFNDGTKPYESEYIVEAKTNLDFLTATEKAKLNPGVETKINSAFETYNSLFEQISSFTPGPFASAGYASTQNITSIEDDETYGRVANFTITSAVADGDKACASLRINSSDVQNKKLKFAIKNVDGNTHAPRICFQYWDMKGINESGWTEYEYTPTQSDFSNGLWLKIQLQEEGSASSNLLDNTNWAISNVYIVK